MSRSNSVFNAACWSFSICACSSLWADSTVCNCCPDLSAHSCRREACLACIRALFCRKACTRSASSSLFDSCSISPTVCISFSSASFTLCSRSCATCSELFINSCLRSSKLDRSAASRASSACSFASRIARVRSISSTFASRSRCSFCIRVARSSCKEAIRVSSSNCFSCLARCSRARCSRSSSFFHVSLRMTSLTANSSSRLFTASDTFLTQSSRMRRICICRMRSCAATSASSASSRCFCS
mmetsp:Transcript_20709/g.34671  ORF Transcript_20709/g.34671 Transcript_20709/m.34671 type:complete len:243 (+) Transcript_20709:1808-2536(+)